MQRKAIKVALVGTPNVGKSVIFNYLTGAYVTVSNYPGTTVDISRGRMIRSGEYFEIVVNATYRRRMGYSQASYRREA